ncbi:ATP-binding cassette domain-containing protein [Dyella sp. 2RAB6]|uniref:ATP-binding cassette domain-containing protein n=1 Tax=Dyella sp. 2RAB6 TaxID=3232992 RepID=UPI003F8E6B6F
MLALYDIEIMRGTQCVLRQVSLEVERPGALFLVGGGGSGKSSLLGAIAARGDAAWLGVASWRGLPLAVASPAIGWLGQCDLLEEGVPAASHAWHAWLREIRRDHEADAQTPVSAWPRALRRYLAVMAALAAPADLYLLDEPTAGLDEAMARVVRDRVSVVASRACVVVATHNRLDCLHVGGATALLAGRALQECTPTRTFFREPRTPAGRIYVDTGNCNLATPHNF